MVKDLQADVEGAQTRIDYLLQLERQQFGQIALTLRDGAVTGAATQHQLPRLRALL